MLQLSIISASFQRKINLKDLSWLFKSKCSRMQIIFVLYTVSVMWGLTDRQDWMWCPRCCIKHIPHQWHETVSGCILFLQPWGQYTVHLSFYILLHFTIFSSNTSNLWDGNTSHDSINDVFSLMGAHKYAFKSQSLFTPLVVCLWESARAGSTVQVAPEVKMSPEVVGRRKQGWNKPPVLEGQHHKSLE